MSLYLEHFGLSREPFSIVPDPSFLYPSHYHRQAVAHLKYGLEREGGFVLLTGEVGTGKTTLIRTFVKGIPAHVRIAYILNSQLEVSDLLASICHELSVKPVTRGGLSFIKACTDALYDDLLADHARGNKTLIIIEEAQNLGVDVLETLRLLSNLETHTAKLLHILLVGQPEFLEILAQRDMRQLNQRVVARFHLQPIDRKELADYVRYRLRKAGATRDIFEDSCIPVIYKLTDGIPRLINLICQHALVAAYATGRYSISKKLLKEAAVEAAPLSGSGRGVKGLRMVVLSLAVIVILGFFALREAIKTNDFFIDTGPFLDSPADTADVEANILVDTTQPNTVSSDLVVSEQTSLGLVETNQNDSSRPLPKNLGDLNDSSDHSEAQSFDAKNELLKLWIPDSLSVLSSSYAKEILRLKEEVILLSDLDSMRTLDRPGLVTLSQEGRAKTMVLVEIENNFVTLRGEFGDEKVEFSDLFTVWNKEYEYIWRPPPNYEILQRGERNKLLIDWLQERFLKLDSAYEQIITGGRYTEALQIQVLEFQRFHGLQQDGILGPETIMMINRLTDLSTPSIWVKKI
ncbi:MAG: hypothetical protein CBC09_00885 [Cellvibrionales bacterium TMED49]|nr:hypothetical protein [Porticoccaceae bacterium]OUU40101.1 MAG: hypothetical protein CBC09_00885 [Cellvibrionales bacterium TMED49]